MEILRRHWPNLNGCSEADFVELLHYHLETTHPSTRVLSAIEEAIQSDRLPFETILANWPTRDTRLRAAKQKFEKLNGASSNLSETSSELQTPITSLAQYKTFLPLIKLGFEAWMTRQAHKWRSSNNVDRQTISSVSVVVNEYISLLLLTLLDWLEPGLEKRPEWLNHDFHQFEVVAELLHTTFTSPCSCYLIELASWLNMDEVFEVSPKNALRMLIDTSATYDDAYVHETLEAVFRSYCNIFRPTFLEELEQLDILRERKRPQLGTSSFAAAPPHVSDSGISWVMLCHETSSVPAVHLWLQELILGDYMYHTPMIFAVQALSTFRAVFNESIPSLLTSLLVAFLHLEKQEQKNSVPWYRCRMGMNWTLPKLLRATLQCSSSPASLVPPIDSISEQENMIKAAHTFIVSFESAYVRTMVDTADENGMSVERSVSLLTEVITILGRNQLLSYDGLQRLIEDTRRDELRALLDGEAVTWHFSLEGPPGTSDGSKLTLDSDLQMLLASWKSCDTFAEFLEHVDTLTREIVNETPRGEQIAHLLLEFLNTPENDIRLLNSSEVGGNEGSGSQDPPRLISTKFGLLFEHLCYAPILEMLLLVISLSDFVSICFELLVRHGESADEFGFSKFSSAMLFLLHLLATSGALKCAATRQRILDDFRAFCQYKHPEWLQDDVSTLESFLEADRHPTIAPSGSSGLLEFLHGLFTRQSRQFGRGPATSTMERQMAILYNPQATATDVCAFTPWTWISSLPHLLDTSIKFTAVRGPNEEPTRLLDPLVEGMNAVSTVLPCLRPLIIHQCTTDLSFGSGDQNLHLQDYILPLVLEQISNNWLLAGEDHRQFARIVSISHCKYALAQLAINLPAISEQNWGHLVIRDLIPDAMIERQQLSSASEYSIDNVVAEIVADPTNPVRLKSTLLTSLSSTYLDPLEVVSCIMRPIFAHQQHPQPTQQNGSQMGQAQNPSTSLLSPRSVEICAHMLAFCAPQKCITVFFNQYLPTTALSARKNTAADYSRLAHLAFAVIMLTGVLPRYRQMPHHMSPSDIELLQSIYRFYEVLIHLGKNSMKDDPSNPAVLSLVFFQMASAVSGLTTLFEPLTPKIFSMLMGWGRHRTALQAVYADAALTSPLQATPELEEELFAFWRLLLTDHLHDASEKSPAEQWLSELAEDLPVVEVLRLS